MKSKNKPAPTPASKSPTPNKRIVICLPEEFLPLNPVLGEALYIYLWCIYRTTAEYRAGRFGQRIGLIYNGAPVKDSEIAEELGCSTKSIQRWRNKAEEIGMIRTQQAGRGTIYAVMDSYKFNAKDVKLNPPEWTLMSTLKK